MQTTSLMRASAGSFSTQLLRARAVLLTLLFCFGCTVKTAAYAVLAHETIIDAVWDSHLRPLLLKRFPHTDLDELREAHGYAYGGAIIQDIGYYPHGSHFITGLMHYCRSGDFILALLRDSQNVNEYAFALGALSHYAADNDGHRLGTNRAVPILYPRLQKKYGTFVTYEEDPLAHIKTEFGFDVLEVAKGRYAPDAYHDFIGFGELNGCWTRRFKKRTACSCELLGRGELIEVGLAAGAGVYDGGEVGRKVECIAVV